MTRHLHVKVDLETLVNLTDAGGDDAVAIGQTVEHFETFSGEITDLDRLSMDHPLAFPGRLDDEDEATGPIFRNGVGGKQITFPFVGRRRTKRKHRPPCRSGHPPLRPRAAPRPEKSWPAPWRRHRPGSRSPQSRDRGKHRSSPKPCPRL